MRKDCEKLFKTACARDDAWLGQILIVAEVSKDGVFVRSRAELRVRDSPDVWINLWGWEGRPAAAPPPPVISPPGPLSRRVVPLLPLQAAAPSWTKRPWNGVWAGLEQFEATWTNGEVVKLNDFFREMRLVGLLKNADRVVSKNRSDRRLLWRVRSDYSSAETRAQGRNKQGGGNSPVVVEKSSLRAYYNIL